MLLFREAEDLAGKAQSVWIGSIAFGTAVSVVAIVFVWLGAKQSMVM